MGPCLMLTLIVLQSAVTMGAKKDDTLYCKDDEDVCILKCSNKMFRVLWKSNLGFEEMSDRAYSCCKDIYGSYQGQYCSIEADESQYSIYVDGVKTSETNCTKIMGLCEATKLIKEDPDSLSTESYTEGNKSLSPNKCDSYMCKPLKDLAKEMKDNKGHYNAMDSKEIRELAFANFFTNEKNIWSERAKFAVTSGYLFCNWPGSKITSTSIVYGLEYDTCQMTCTNTNTEPDDAGITYYSESYRYPYMDLEGDSFSLVNACWDESIEEYIDNENSAIVRELWKNKGKKELGPQETHCHPDNCEDNQFLSREVVTVEGRHIEMFTCLKCFQGRYPKGCDISINSDSVVVSIKMSAPIGKYTVSLGEYTEGGHFRNGRTITMDIPSPGKYKLAGNCNGVLFTRSIAMSLGEYCSQKHSGWYDTPLKILCLYRSTVLKLLMSVLVIGAIWCFSRIVSMITSFILSLFIGSVCILSKRMMTCPICKKFRMFDSIHNCDPTTCVFCNKDLMDEKDAAVSSQMEISRIQNRHFKNCEPGSLKGPIALCFYNIYRTLFWMISAITCKAPKYMVGIIIIWFIIIIAPGVTGSRLDDLIGIKVERLLTQLARNISTTSSKRTASYTGRQFNKKCKTIGTWLMITYSSILLLITIIYTASKKLASLVLKLRLRSSKSSICPFCYYVINSNYHDCKKIICPSCLIHVGTTNVVEKTHTRRVMRDHVYEICCFKSDLEASKQQYNRSIKSKLGMSIKLILCSAVVLCLIGAAGCNKGNVPHSAISSQIEMDMKSFIEQLSKEGFHPFHARFTGVARERVSSLEEVKNCKEGTCTLDMKMEALIDLRGGREFGYDVKVQEQTGKQMHITNPPQINIKVQSVKSECTYKKLYETGPVTHSMDQYYHCTQSGTCNECREHLYESPEGKYMAGPCYYDHHGTNSWACNGGCFWNNGEGCTCSVCWCSMKEPTRMVLKKVNEIPVAEICIQAGAEGYCANFGQETHGEVISIIKTGDYPKQCPEIITTDMNMNDVREGPINDFGEFDQKFGSVQGIESATESNGESKVAGGKCDFQKTEKCSFTRSRLIQMSQCCVDTYHMLKYLQPSHMERKAEGKFTKELLDSAGTWSIKVKVPRMSYSEGKEVATLSKLNFGDCKGCYSCSEGGLCLITLVSSMESNLDINCYPCNTDMNHVRILQGLNKISLYIYCGKKDQNVTCKIGNDSVSGLAKLIDPPTVPHGDGIINLDPRLMKDSDICDFWCGVKKMFTGVGWLYYFKIAIICVAAIIGIILTIWIVRVAYGFTSMATPNFVPRRKTTWKKPEGRMVVEETSMDHIPIGRNPKKAV